VALENGDVEVWLYQTNIFVQYADGHCAFTLGGDNTPTTRSRIHELLPAKYGLSCRKSVPHLNETPIGKNEWIEII
jgi:hypothetical protein